MDSTNTLPQIEASQVAKEVTANELFAAASPAMQYGYNADTSAGLVFGYFGARRDDATLIAAGTHTCTTMTTVYMVANKTTGAVSFSTSSTNWDNHTDYGQAYKITAGASTLTYLDCRGGVYGVLSGGAAGVGSGDMLLASVQTVTGAKTFGSAGAVGKLKIAGTTSGAATLDAAAVAGTAVITLPSTTSTLATTVQADEMISGYIGTVADKTYKIVVKAAHGGTITETTTISESGTVTATFKINTTALGGTVNSVSTSEQSQAQASANVFAAGDDLQITTSSNSACVGMSFTIKYTRTLA